MCTDGTWEVDEVDTGFDVIDEGCTPESHRQFCQRHDVECGTFEHKDNCGGERIVHCEQFDGYGCEYPESCEFVDDGDIATNVCQCPELGDDPDDEICDWAGAECGTIDAAEICADWNDFGDVDCGDCDGGDECGEHLDNVCGCPCEVDDHCYADGESSPHEECMVCDPDRSHEEFSPADDGTDCQDAGVCQDGECICQDDATFCDDECVDTDSNRDHCGDCANSCAENEICDGGNCIVSCPDDQSVCDGECVDTDSDSEHCGECNNSCVGDDDTTAFCEGGECVFECIDDDLTYCDGDCVDIDSDPSHCGGCHQECSTDADGATAECVGGECQINCDDDDLTYCEDDDLCTDLRHDHDHCGECGNECTGNDFCNDGECESFDASCDDHEDCASGEQCCEEVCLPAAAQC